MIALLALGIVIAWGALGGVTWVLLAPTGKDAESDIGAVLGGLLWPLVLPWISVVRLVQRQRVRALEKRKQEEAIEREIWN